MFVFSMQKADKHKLIERHPSTNDNQSLTKTPRSHPRIFGHANHNLEDESANECPDCVAAQLLYRQTRSQQNYQKDPEPPVTICYQNHSIMSIFSSDKFRLLSMLSLTFFFFLVEIIVGYLTNSTALIADSFHMLSDVVALLIAFISVRVSS